MRYTRLATYDITKGNFPELTGIVEKGLVPLLTPETGFVSYGLVDAGHNKAISITTWESRDQAQNSATMAANWVKENIADRVRLVTSHVGDYGIFRSAPVSA